MNQLHPDNTFSEALRVELVSRAQKAPPSRPVKRTRLWISAGALACAGLLAGTTVLVTASAPTPPDRFLDASRIIPSLSEPQKDTDKIPATVNPDLFSHMVLLDAVGSRDIDPTKTRRVGRTATRTVYAAPAGTAATWLRPSDWRPAGRSGVQRSAQQSSSGYVGPKVQTIDLGWAYREVSRHKSGGRPHGDRPPPKRDQSRVRPWPCASSSPRQP